MTAPLLPGATFAGLRIDSVIGRGGMGVVYRAVDPSLDRPVALKVIAPELAQEEPFRRRFLREPRLAASLDHPHVVPVYDAGEVDGQLYLAMRLVEGEDLEALLARRPEPDRVLRIVAQIAGALDAAHRRGLVHRDVKPANILLDEDEHAYLTDFGVSTTPADSTADGRLAGTLSYMAPERIRGEQVDGRTDEYALACVLFEGLTGGAPFRRRTEAETLWSHMRDDPPTVDPPRLDAVLRRGLAKEPADRYPTCGALVDAAGEALGRTGPPVGVPAWRRRARRWLGIITGGAAVLAAGVAGVLALTTSDGEGRRRTRAVSRCST
jgi:serine/threonine protein kinase